jgi:AcrR family transcriptional regulator
MPLVFSACGVERTFGSRSTARWPHQRPIGSDAPVSTNVKTKDEDRRGERLKRGVLTPELIVEESIGLLDSGGVAGLSMPKLGRVLGADPTAVYRYFRSKDDLVLAIADRLIEHAVDGFTPAECWVDTIYELARRIRSVYREHPAAASLASYRTTQRPAEMRAVEWLLGAVAEAGFAGEQAALVYRAVADFSLYMAGGEAALMSLEPAQQESDAGAWTRAYRAVDADEHPNIHALREALPRIGDDDDAVYERALELFMAGVQAAAPKRCPCPPGTHALR